MVNVQVQDFMDWKFYNQTAENNAETGQDVRFYSNTSSFPDNPTGRDDDIELTAEEQALILAGEPFELVHAMARSEHKYGSDVDRTLPAFDVFNTPTLDLYQTMLDNNDLDPWSTHTITEALTHRMYDTSVRQNERVVAGYVLSRVLFVTVHRQFVPDEVTTLVANWKREFTGQLSDEDLEAYIHSTGGDHGGDGNDEDTIDSVFKTHDSNFAQQFRIYEKQPVGISNPSFFLTMSCAENHWQDLWALFEKYVALLPSAGDPWLARVKLEGFKKSRDRDECLSRYPHISTTFFKLRTELFFSVVLTPVLGITDYFIRYEFATGRGEIHAHCLAWSSKFPIGRLLEEGDQTQVLHFARCWLRLSATHPSDDLQGQKYHEYANPTGDPKSWAGPHHPCKKLFATMTTDSVQEWDIASCNCCYWHNCQHSSYCLRKTRGRKTDAGPGCPGDRTHKCRWDFHENNWSGKSNIPPEEARIEQPVPPANKSQLVMERNSPLLVQHSKFFRRAWKANSDVTVLVDKDPSLVAFYVVSYLCKEEASTAEYKSIFRNILSDTSLQSVSTLVRKMMMVILGVRDKQSQEVLFCATGNNLIQFSRARGLVIRLSDFRRVLSKDSFLGKNVIDKYVQDKAGDRGVTLYEFAISQSTGWIQFSGYHSKPTWPVSEGYSRNALIMHLPWSRVKSVLRKRNDDTSIFATYKSKFVLDYLYTPDCPRLIYKSVMLAKSLHDNPELRPAKNYSILKAGTGAVSQFLKAFGNRSLNADFNATHAGGVRYNAAPPSYNWADLTNWNSFDPATFDIQAARSIATYTPDNERDDIKTLTDLDPLSRQSLEDVNQRGFVGAVLGHCLHCHKSTTGYKTKLYIAQGAGGAGKSHGIKIIHAGLAALTGDVDSVRVTAPTGGAAAMVDGETLHRGLGINIDLTPLRGDRVWILMSEMGVCKVLVIDEMSLLDQKLFCVVERQVRTLRQIISRWGHLWAVILAGDFMQLPPVRGTSLFDTSLNGSEEHRTGYALYREFNNVFVLESNHRLDPSQQQLRECLQSIRDGKLSSEILEVLNTRVLPRFSDHEKLPFAGQDTSYFVAYNAERLEINMTHVSILPGPVCEIISVDTGTRHVMGSDSSQNFGGLQQILWLGQGMRVVVCMNLCTRKRITKGQCGTVEHVFYADGESPPQLPFLVLVNMDNDVHSSFANTLSPEKRFRNLLQFKPRRVDDGTHCCSRTQIPLEIAAGFTVHKAQGATVTRPTVLQFGAKAESQWPGIMYTALSRFRKMEQFALAKPISREMMIANQRQGAASGRTAEVKRLKQLANRTRDNNWFAREEAYVALMLEFIGFENARQ